MVKKRNPKDLPPLPPGQKFVGVIRLANIMGISLSKAYVMLNKGLIPAKRIGRRRLIRIVDIEKFMDPSS